MFFYLIILMLFKATAQYHNPFLPALIDQPLTAELLESCPLKLSHYDIHQLALAKKEFFQKNPCLKIQLQYDLDCIVLKDYFKSHFLNPTLALIHEKIAQHHSIPLIFQEGEMQATHARLVTINSYHQTIKELFAEYQNLLL